MGTRRLQSLSNGSEGKLSVPPGFVSLTSLTLKRAASGSEEATDNMTIERNDPLSNHAIKKFKTAFNQRPWILHNQFDCALQNYNLQETEVDKGRSLGASLPKGVFRGCASCHDCVKVTARWHPEESCLPVLDDAPVFHPTEEEFKDPMKYISKIRLRAENYGICRIVPPPSWRPPCLLEDTQTWKNSTFNTHIQQIDGLKNLYAKRKLSKTADKLGDEGPKISVSMDLESLDESADLNQVNCIAVSSDFDSGPEHTLQSFKKYADDFKSQYFCKNDETTDSDVNLNADGHKSQRLLIARLEGEYWRIIEKPSEEIEVLYGTDLESRTLGSGFPVKGCVENKVDHSEYVESPWNLHNVPKLSSSLLPFGCDSTSAILVPQLFVGMSFTSQCWRNEDHHLYSLCYMHLGDPKVWYGIPGRYCFKFVEVAKKLCPELSEYPSLIHELVYQLSPSMLKSEGIPVYRCVQNPREFILVFPGAYHTEFDCGFNCSESVHFAPFDWLPHGLNTVERYNNDFCRKSSISYDRLLIGAAIEAVTAQWETLAMRNESLCNQLWKSVCGKDGLLTKAFKSRVRLERIRREHMCDPSQSRVLDEADAVTKRECSICLCDLYLSATCCSCSPNKYACLRHAKQLCYCISWADKFFLFRYRIAELDSLVEALEGNLRATHIWVKKKIRPIPDSCAVKDSLHQPESGDRSPAATSMSPRPVSSGQNIVQHSNPGLSGFMAAEANVHAEPDDREFIWVDNGTFWPDNHKVSAYITSRFALQTCVTGHSWKGVTAAQRQWYWDEFVKKYKWDASDDEVVRALWYKNSSALYRRTIHSWRHSGCHPESVTEEQWAMWMAVWEGEGWKEKAAKNRVNRNSEPAGPGTGTTKHIAGSKTYADHVHRLRQQHGHDPTAWELFLHTHRHPDGTFVDERSRLVHEQMETYMDQSITSFEDGSTSNRPTTLMINSMFKMVTGGPKKGRMYGLGTMAGTMFPEDMAPRPRGGAAGASSSSTREETRQLREDLIKATQEAREARTECDELRIRISDLETSVREFMASQERLSQQQAQMYHPHIPFVSPTHRYGHPSTSSPHGVTSSSRRAMYSYFLPQDEGDDAVDRVRSSGDMYDDDETQAP